MPGVPMLRFAVLMSLTASAYAQQCPEGGERGPRVPAGSPLTILATDGGRIDLIGQTGTSDDLWFVEDCWYSGSIATSSGDYVYYDRVAVDAAGAGGTQPSCGPDAMSTPPQIGEEVLIRSVHPDDGYYGDAQLAPGTVLIPTERLHSNDRCFFGGAMETPDGQHFYFYKVSLMTARDRCPANALTTLPMSGDTYRVTGVHSKSPDPDAIAVNSLVTVAETDAGHLDATCWYYGGLLGPDGEPVTAAGVTLARTDGSSVLCQGGMTRPAIGSTVRVTAVRRTDPYAAVAGRVVGVVGTVERVGASRDGCWHGLDLRAASGVRYRFSSVATEPVNDTTR